ncbi:hypothetical protein ACYSNX_12025 [Myroides sp. LJL115]
MLVLNSYDSLALEKEKQERKKKKMMNNPLLQPINRISLQDYAAITLKMTNGCDLTDILAVLDIDWNQYLQAAQTWNQRIITDSSYELSALYGKWFTKAGNHPILSQLQPNLHAVDKMS